jgi:dTDP-4-dehydrorhamnose reductase
MRRILITGATGLLGPFLMSEAAYLGSVLGLARNSVTNSVDLTKIDQVRTALKGFDPEIILHAAAMTDVDRCESDPERAFQQNKTATENLAEVASTNCKIVYFSTDQVYPNRTGPHKECDSSPINIYGKSKFAGEQAVLQRKNSLVLRTNFLCRSRSKGRLSLFDFFFNAIVNRQKISVFSDVLFSPISASTLAQVTLELAILDLSGIFNVGARNGLSKARVFSLVSELLGIEETNAVVTDSRSIKTRTQRPLDLRMQVNAIEKVMGRRMPTVQQELKGIIYATSNN